MSLTRAEHSADVGALAFGAAGVLALARGTANSPNAVAMQSDMTSGRTRRSREGCDIKPSPSDSVTGTALARSRDSRQENCVRLPVKREMTTRPRCQYRGKQKARNQPEAALSLLLLLIGGPRREPSARYAADFSAQSR